MEKSRIALSSTLMGRSTFARAIMWREREDAAIPKQALLRKSRVLRYQDTVAPLSMSPAPVLSTTGT